MTLPAKAPPLKESNGVSLRALEEQLFRNVESYQRPTEPQRVYPSGFL